MSKSFIDSLPESYRKHYQNITINPKATKVQFDTLKKIEEVKEHTRTNSNLYKIMGEGLHGVTTIDGRLHLEIDVFSQEPIVNALNRELDILETCRCVLTGVGEGVITPPEHLKDVQWKQMVFGVNEILEGIKEDKEAIKEAISKVKELFKEDTEQKYFPKEARDDLQSIVKMQKEVSRRSISVHQVTYLRMAIVAKELDNSIAGINWRFHLQ